MALENGRSLEARLRAMEDRLEIYNLIAAHGPSADTGTGCYAEAVFTTDGVFDRGVVIGGNVSIGKALNDPDHVRAIEGGLAHFHGLPHIQLSEDSAIVTSYLQILHPDNFGTPRTLPNHGQSPGFRIHCVLANEWHLVRKNDRWQIKSRKIRQLNGDVEARELLGNALADYRK